MTVDTIPSAATTGEECAAAAGGNMSGLVVEFCRRHATDGSRGAAGVSQIDEPVLVQTGVPELSVEALHQCVLDRRRGECIGVSFEEAKTEIPV